MAVYIPFFATMAVLNIMNKMVQNPDLFVVKQT